MITYSIKDLMVHIDNITQQRHAAAAFIGFNHAQSPTRNDSISNNNVSSRLRRTLALQSMLAEVFRSSIDTGNNGSYSRMISTNDSRDLDKINTISTNIPLMKKSSGENEDKLIEQSTNRINTNIPTMINTTTIDWTPTE
ncbi:unnamed protein product [Rotaria sp. Silwood1]|nr:unnamed protein product [Rotaria sp. Silwood1]CAF4826790.1 unnamed protein product [Rotaria sp. Silwood1]